MSEDSDDRSATDPFRALAAVLAQGLGLSAWLGCALADYTRRTASDMADIARDKAARDAQIMARALGCRDTARLAEIRQEYLGETLRAATEAAGRQAEKTAIFCATALDRMTPPREDGS